jgi:hypothetical protein
MLRPGRAEVFALPDARSTLTTLDPAIWSAIQGCLLSKEDGSSVNQSGFDLNVRGHALSVSPRCMASPMFHVEHSLCSFFSKKAS